MGPTFKRKEKKKQLKMIHSYFPSKVGIQILTVQSLIVQEEGI